MHTEKRSTAWQCRAKLCTMLLLGLCGVVLYAVVLPSMLVSQIDVTSNNQKLSLDLRPSMLASSRRSRRALMLAKHTQQETLTDPIRTRWEQFWGSDAERGEQTVQQRKLIILLCTIQQRAIS